WYLVKPMAMAAAAMGADGIIVEVHPEPDHAWSDGPQALTYENFADMMQSLDAVVRATGRQMFSARAAFGSCASRSRGRRPPDDRHERLLARGQSRAILARRD